jgi:limonene-1,2-epoxide hydrolase
LLRAPTGEVAATGKKIEIRACQVIEVANDKVQAMRQYFDLMTMMQQLGVVSAV